MKNKLFIIAFGLSLQFLFGCQFTTEDIETTPLEGSMESLNVPFGFNFQTSKDIEINIKTEENFNSIIFSLIDNEGNLLCSGKTDKENPFTTKITLPAHHDSIFVKTQTLGYNELSGIEILDKKVDFNFAKPVADSNLNVVDNSNRRVTATNYKTIGNWDVVGRPLYLEPENDNISQQLLDDISASLPESRPVPEYNPEYLVDNNMNTELQAEADIWVTFVHEGAGWKNTLGYYTYDINNPPSSIEEITDHYIIFPNVSYNGSGGNLASGDKVKLGKFPANTGIGWFLIPNAWNAGTAGVDSKSQVKYSVKAFNDFTNAEYAQHVILLKDEARQLILLGIEDISRPAGDNDFNDAIFYVTANPYSAIITSELQKITESTDNDSDGVLDHLDEYPDDGNKAFNAYLPAKNITGSLAFEDLWPAKGDYDFNDLVIDYQYKKILSPANKIQEIEATYTIKAIGGYYHNGFGVSFPFAATQTSNVNGTVSNNQYTTINTNGTEAGQSNAVVIMFEDAYDIIPVPQGATLVNARYSEPKVTPVSKSVIIDLVDNTINNGAVSLTTINPFLIVNQNRSHEIHLPGKSPTILMDYTLFGKAADNSNPDNNRFYISDTELPWSINLNRSFDYPVENAPINKAFSLFTNWAESNGSLNQDWYYNKTGYRKTNFIYNK